ncbi:MAG: methionine--tRNA ligase [Gemmatimonadetes bacterium RIFCSPLOWO2_12_FULL_68_9]|nr:MAG: methionine--tRNA ligase [Gemmatimonadetes bacterium RIFCSPLOWO2_12_FULL_68_9]
MSRYFVTTAIYYTNAVPHLGTAYEILGTDAIARWRRLRGDEVFFLSGNDDHALKVAHRAAEQGKTPEAYCDEMAGAYEGAWKSLLVEYDEYVRTASDRHRDTVRWFFERVRERDRGRAEPLLYKGSYEGLYCVGCEAYLREKELVDGKCPGHPGRTVQRLEEENWFFRLSAFTERLDRWLRENPDWLAPEAKRNEMRALLREGLQDVSISRPRRTIPWGIPFPGDEGTQTVYVWFDALINYVTAARLAGDGKARPDEPGRGPGFWPADLHVIGKDIVRFHALLWPAMLWAAELPLPRAEFVHGFVQVGGEKMSKSQGEVVSPVGVAREYGADALRYFLLREVSWGSDGEFSIERLEERYASDLANTVGNLLHRTLTMVEKYFDGVVPGRSGNDYSPEGEEIHSVGALELLVLARRGQAARAYDALDPARALELTVDIARQANQRIDSVAPWRLVKESTGEGRKVVGDLLLTVAEGLKNVAVLLSPVLPMKSRALWLQLGLEEWELDGLRIGIPGEGQGNAADLEELRPEGWFAAVDAVETAGRRVRKGDPLFPRRDAREGEGR